MKAEAQSDGFKSNTGNSNLQHSSCTNCLVASFNKSLFDVHEFSIDFHLGQKSDVKKYLNMFEFTLKYMNIERLHILFKHFTNTANNYTYARHQAN